jgi:diguanylate cyclase (GGDEF)-like protein
MSVAASEWFPSLGVTPQQAADLRRGLVIASGVLAVLVLVGAILVLRLVGAPVRRVSREINARAQTGDLTVPVPPPRLREMRLLVEAFNGLQDFYLKQGNEMAATRALLEEVSTRDPLTRLVDRRVAVERIELELRRSRRTGLPCSIIVIDIDDFEAFVEKNYLTPADELLVDIAVAVRGFVRTTDMVARWGGAELLAILMDTDELGAVHVAEGVRAKLKDAQEASRTPVTVSIGVATSHPQQETTAEALWSRAETAVALAQRDGGDRVCISG